MSSETRSILFPSNELFFIYKVIISFETKTECDKMIVDVKNEDENFKKYEEEKKKLSNVKAEVARLKAENEELKLEVQEAKKRWYHKFTGKTGADMHELLADLDEMRA